MRPWLKRLAVAVFVSSLAFASLVALGKPPDAGKSDPATAELERLQAKAADSKANVEALWQELLAFRVKYPGTPQAVRAAELLARLPSPLDKLDRSQIPAEDRLPCLPEEVVAVLGEHRGRHWGWVDSVVHSPDGKLVASVGSDGVRLWDAATLHAKAFLRSDHHPDRFGVAFSPDGKTLALSDTVDFHGDPGVRLLDVSTGQPREVAVIRGTGSRGVAVAISPDGRFLARGGYQGDVSLFDLRVSPPRQRGQMGELRGPVRSLAFSADGGLLMAGDDNETVCLWDLKGEQPRKRLRVTERGGPLRAWTADFKAVAVANRDGVTVWDLSSGEAKRVKDLDFKRVLSLAFSPDGRALACALDDDLLLVWPLDEGKRRQLGLPAESTHSITRLPFGPGQLSFSPDGKMLVLGHRWGGTLHLWDVGQAAEVFNQEGQNNTLTAVFTPDCQRLLTGGSDQTIRCWELAGARFHEQAVLRGHAGSVHSLVLSPDGRVLASCAGAGVKDGLYGYDLEVRLWDLSVVRPTERAAFEAHERRVYSVALSPDGRTLATTGDDPGIDDPRAVAHFVRFWDWTVKPVRERDRIKVGVDSPENLQRPELQAARCVTYSPDGKLLAYALEGKVHLCDSDIFPPRARGTLPCPTEEIYSLAFSPDGKTLAYSYMNTQDPVGKGGHHRFVCLWRVGKEPSGQTNALGIEDLGGSLELAFSPDGKLLLGVDARGNLFLWDVGGARMVRRWLLPGPIRAGVFAGDGRHVATANRNGTVYVFRLGGKDYNPGARAIRG
jgi:WD40 repeat protein